LASDYFAALQMQELIDIIAVASCMSRKGSTLDGCDDLSGQGQCLSVIESYPMKIGWFKGG
jgi:hypothetical protein